MSVMRTTLKRFICPDKKKGNSELIISKKVFHPEMQISPTVSILAKVETLLLCRSDRC